MIRKYYYVTCCFSEAPNFKALVRLCYLDGDASVVVKVNEIRDYEIRASSISDFIVNPDKMELCDILTDALHCAGYELVADDWIELDHEDYLELLNK